jgi:hypothetical protein
VALAYSGAVTAGSTLVFAAWWYNDTGSVTSPTVSDTVNGAWTVQSYLSFSAADANIQVAVGTFENTGAGTPTVTFNPDGNAYVGGFAIGEVTDAATSSIDKSNVTGQNASSQAPSIASGALAQADEAIFAAFSSNFSGTQTINKDATYTEWAEEESNATQAGASQYKVVASTSSDTADWTFGGGTGGWVAALMSIKKTAGAATGSIRKSRMATLGVS